MSIITLDDAKAQLGIAASNTGDDAELQGYVDAITGVVEQHLHEVVERRTVTDELELCGRRSFRLWSAPVISLTSLASLDGATAWDVDDLHVSPSGLVRVMSGSAPYGWVRATYEAGYEVVPDRYVRGALVILQHVWETQRGTMGPPVGVIGHEEAYDPRYSFSIPRKALEWLGCGRPLIA